MKLKSRHQRREESHHPADPAPGSSEIGRKGVDDHVEPIQLGFKALAKFHAPLKAIRVPTRASRF